MSDQLLLQVSQLNQDGKLKSNTNQAVWNEKNSYIMSTAV